MDKQFLILAANYAADKHKYQRRKGFNQVPYINHPLKVAEVLIGSGVEDTDVLAASILHDVIEDTDATEQEIAELFNSRISKLVEEVSDDKDLPYTIRKELQVKSAPDLSYEAKLLKIADKICNISDILTYPVDWSPERKIAYLDWSQQVVSGCRGVNEVLENRFDEIYEKGLEQLKADL